MSGTNDMKHLLIIFFVFLLWQVPFAQKETVYNNLSLLSKVSNIPFDACAQPYKDCGDNIFWDIVKIGKPAIKSLISNMSDTSFSDTYYHGIRLRTGVIAYIALDQIISIPIAKITGLQFDVFDCGWYPSGLILYINDSSNRQEFQKQIEKYYRSGSFKWVINSKEKLSNCAQSHGIKGRFQEE